MFGFSAAWLRKKQGLPFRYLRNDPYNIIMKTHIQHPVSLIQHQELEFFQLYITHVDMGDEFAWRTDYNICTLERACFSWESISSPPP
jgi:hypothetical protein